MQNVNRILVLGGGSAGWLTACILAAKHKNNRNFSITLVESSDVPSVGVGEGTWPTMRNTLHSIGIKESDFIRHCNASFKQGSEFVDWHQDASGKSRYLHPFTPPKAHGQFELAPYWQAKPAVEAKESFADSVCFQAAICASGRAPKTMAESEYQGVANYGYHLDAGRFAELLKRHGISTLGISHKVATFEQAHLDCTGNISAIEFTDGSELSADLFVDCSGFSALLIGKVMQVPFIDKSNEFAIDSALATQIPYSDDAQDIACQTISTAQPSGWIWDIGLQNRRGVGHVYSSKHISDDEALSQLADYLKMDAQMLNARQLRFKPGYREKFWQGNVVAIGLSAGFVEPLEASALMLIETSAQYLADNLPVETAHIKVISGRFNREFIYRWQKILDFLKLHYMLSERQEPFWQQMRVPESISENLAELLALWRYRPPLTSDFASNFEVFPAASYQYVLYGMHYQSNFSAHNHLYQEQEKADKLMAINQQMTTQALARLPSHRALLNAIKAS